MAGPGLGPRAEMSQIFFWTPGAHSSQRNTEADTGQVTEQRGPRGAQSALAASRGVLQAEVSHGESPPSPDWPLPPPNVLPALPCQALATEARGWGGPGPRPGVSSQPIGGPQASSPRGRHGPLSGVPETEADLHPRSLQELARQHHGEHAASVSILARGRSGGDTEAAVPCPLRAPLRLKCLPGFTFRARRPALQGFTGPREAHSGPTAGRWAGTLTSPTQASPLDHTPLIEADTTGVVSYG